jgi:polyisoprenoid-binding protein YceI
MKTLSTISLLLLLFSSAYLPAQTAYTFAGTPSIIIEGTSNVHDWEMKVETITGGGTITWNPDGSFSLNSLLVKINCKAIKSTHGSIMDNKTYDALKADKFPDIMYKLTSSLNGIKPLPGGTSVNTTGEITVAGVTKTITMQVKIIPSASGQLSFVGTENINMRDFGISPPTAFMGAMKVGENVVVKFNTGFVKMAGNASQTNN